MTIYNYLLS